jgi:hypothetical protein
MGLSKKQNRKVGLKRSLDEKIRIKPLVEVPLTNYGVILIDMQASFLKRVNEREKSILIQTQIEMIRFCAKYDLPVVVLEYQTFGQTIPILKQEIEKLPRTKTLLKPHASGFSVPYLSELLNGWNLQTICLTGIFEGYCVLRTVEDAIEKGYRTISANGLIARENVGGISNYTQNLIRENGAFYKNYRDLLRTKKLEDKCVD